MKWIKCSDTLPEKGICVLLWMKKGFIDKGARYDKEYYHENGLYGESGTCPYDNITHWMPLPEAPKEY